ncbi:recombinase family protein [Pedobacter ginsenosidimutans]|uniref:recombinase family protein n=1 Tax=Pedobacter ginsenosidimutans TaxID=687842 RepID=UPI0009F86566
MKKQNVGLLRFRDRRTHKLELKRNIADDKIDTRKVAFLYVRVSTDEQADRGFSQRDQDQRLTEYCERNNIKVGRVIYEDYSAKTFKKRPEWSKMLSELRKTKGRICDLLLFTKWDRFSRNASNAYEMIDILGTLNIIPNAIDQSLDLKIPESRIMLAVYIAQAEADNLRRGLNVVVGMRRGKMEGRWMGRAPAGYINRIEDKIKYIEPLEPEATHMRWAFETLATGTFNMHQIWRLGKERGLRSQSQAFFVNLRNPIYCGLVVVPPDENNDMQIVQGKHQPIISEKTFWDVQDVLNGKRRPKRARAIPPETYPLRGFVTCSMCGKLLTSSASKGRKGIYFYYHCKYPCKARYNCDFINREFFQELEKFQPLPGRAELYRKIIADLGEDDKRGFDVERKRLISEIAIQNNMLTKVRGMFLAEDIDQLEYKIMKGECDERILKLEAELKEFKHSVAVKLDLSKAVDDALIRLERITELYTLGDIEQKRYIIGSIFPEKWQILDLEGRTRITNPAARLIYLINRDLEHKKTGKNVSKNYLSGSVPSAGVEPARFPTGV